MQTCPLFRNLAQTAPRAAISTSASSQTMKGSIPLVSRFTFFKVSAASRMIRFPVSVEPVNAIMSTRRSVTSASPASAPVPVTIWTTPRGRCSKAFARASVASGVWSAGLMTTVFPAASAGATFQLMRRSG